MSSTILWLIAMTDSDPGAQQDATIAAQPDANQNNSVRRKSPPPVIQCIVAKTNDALALQTETSTNNDSTHNSANTRKRARVDRDAESSSGTEKEQARVVRQRCKRQSIEDILNRVVEWSHGAHKTLDDCNQNYKISKDMRETQEKETAELKEGFANLLESTIHYNTRLEDHEKLANKDRTAVEDLAARVQKQEEDKLKTRQLC